MQEKEIIQYQTDNRNFKATILRYSEYWPLFLASVILCISCAFLYLRYTTPEYQVSSTLLIKDEKKGADVSTSTVFSDLDIFQSAKNINNEIQVLKSKSLMQRVLKELGIHVTYYSEGDVKTTEVYGSEVPIRIMVDTLTTSAYDKDLYITLKGNGRFELVYDDEQYKRTYSSGEQIETSFGRFTVLQDSANQSRHFKTIKVKFNNLVKLAISYSRRLGVAPVNKDASVLNISLLDPVPEKGKDIVDKLIDVYNKEAVEDKNQIAANTIEFIDVRLRFLTDQLTNVEKDVEEYKRKHELTDVSSEAELYMKKASEYTERLTDYEIQLDVLNSIEQYLQKDNNKYRLVPSSLNLSDPTLNELIMRFNKFQLDRSRILRSTNNDNPLIQNIDGQLSNLKVNILENLTNIRQGILVTKKNLLSTFREFEMRIQRIPSIERELLEINRQQGIKQGLYLYLLQKREESALSLAATVSNSRVIDPAMAGEEPVKPNKKVMYLLSLILGIAFPFAGFYVQGLMNNQIQDILDVKMLTDTPILGEISHNKERKLLVVTRENKSPVAELFRLVRANLRFAATVRDNSVILVTSSGAGEGKTFFSYNFAATLVLSGKRVAVLDLDLRKPGLTFDLNLQHHPGVTNFLLLPEVGLDEILWPSQVSENLYVVGTGPMPPNPAELLLLPRMEELITNLKARFDYIIIDTSPVGKVADCLALGVHVDSTIYLVRYNRTTRDDITIIDDIYKNKKLRCPFIVLNDAKKGSSYSYGYGYNYAEVAKT